MISETVLEMHYHRPIMDLFRDTFGLGNGGSIRFYKYSPQRECFIGFDQAYAMTDMTENEFFDMLRNAAMQSNYKLQERFLGYFLQFKVVKEMTRRTRYTPTAIQSRPHYRVSLDTTKNERTGLSQHELLFNLSRNAGAMVYYACPMLFDRSALYEIAVDLDKLRLAEVDSCPSPYDDNDRHFIYYDDVLGNPIWTSEPTDGKGVRLSEFAVSLRERILNISPFESAQSLITLLTNPEQLGLKAESAFFGAASSKSVLPHVAESLSVVHQSRLQPEKGYQQGQT